MVHYQLIGIKFIFIPMHLSQRNIYIDHLHFYIIKNFWFIPKWLPIDTFIKKLPYGLYLSGLVPIQLFLYGIRK